MINLYTEIVIQVTEGEKLHLDNKKWYNVIGTLERINTRDGKNEKQDLLIVVSDIGTPVNVFMSKVKIKRADKKGLSGFDPTDFLTEQQK